MNNIWKYSSMSQRERLKAIRAGDEDVYNAEKALGKMVRGAREALGMSTRDVDNWQRLVDEARNSSSNKYAVKNAHLPKTQTVTEAKKTRALNESLESIKDSYKNERSDAISDADKALKDTAERLSAAGYNKEGSTAKKAKSSILDRLYDVLEQLEKEYAKNKNAEIGKYVK